MNIEEIEATEVRRHFRSVLDRAVFRGEATIVVRHGEPVAVVVPVSWCEHVSQSAPPDAGQRAPLQPETSE